MKILSLCPLDPLYDSRLLDMFKTTAAPKTLNSDFFLNVCLGWNIELFPLATPRLSQQYSKYWIGYEAHSVKLIAAQWLECPAKGSLNVVNISIKKLNRLWLCLSVCTAAVWNPQVKKLKNNLCLMSIFYGNWICFFSSCLQVLFEDSLTAMPTQVSETKLNPFNAFNYIFGVKDRTFRIEPCLVQKYAALLHQSKLHISPIKFVLPFFEVFVSA